MAIFGKYNIVETMRAHKSPFWKIYESQQKKDAGNVVASATFDNPELGIEDSAAQLKQALDRISAGRYIMTCYDQPSSKRGGIDSWIEVESSTGASVISGVNENSNTPEFYLEGIGKVTADNFEEAIAKKMQAMLDKQAEEKRIADLKLENEALKKELKENDGAVNKGLMAIGTVAYAALSKTPAFKEMIGVVGQVSAVAKNTLPQNNDVNASHQLGEAKEQLPDNHIEGDNCEIGGVHVNQQRLFTTLDTLGKNNPDVLKHLEILAKLKNNNPDMYSQAVAMAEDL